MAARRLPEPEEVELEEMEDQEALNAPIGLGLDVLPPSIRARRRMWERVDVEARYTPQEFKKRFR